MAAPTAVSNAMLVREYRRELRFVQGLPSFVGLGAIGAVAGAWLLPRINDRLLFLLLALLLSSFLAWRFSSANPRWSPRVQKFGRIPVALTCGVSQGATGISGPLVAAWFQGLGVSRERFVASNTVIFLFTGSVQLLTLSATGQWSNQRFYGLTSRCTCDRCPSIWYQNWSLFGCCSLRPSGECGYRCVHSQSHGSSFLERL